MRSLIALVLMFTAVSGGCKKSAKPTEKQPDQPTAGGTNQPVPPTTTGPQVSAKDMEDIRLSIDTFSGASGQMPPPKMTADALQQAGSPAADMVKKGLIVIAPARTRDDVWAYEAKALDQGGYIVTANGVEQVGAAEAKRRLGK
jgi:hypothetical protein